MIDFKTFNTVGYTIVGRRHSSMGKDNEDGYEVYEDDRLLALCVADGCSESPCAKVASEAVLNALIEFAQGDIWEMRAKQIKTSVLKVIDKHLLAAPYEYRLLACTCALVIYNKLSDSYIALSIGDCQALVMTEELEPKQLLAPVNIFRHREHTVFANSSMAANAMKVEIGFASNIAGFILVSDGAEQLCEPANAEDLVQLSSACVLSTKHAQAAIEDHVSNVIAPATNDDITVLMTMRSNSDRITSIAKATCNTVIETDADEDDEAVSEYRSDEDVADDRILDTDDIAASETSSAILNFLATPRTAEELVVASYCIPSEVLSYLYPLIKEGFVVYDDYHFSTVKGG